jgi:hypothetical protein
LGILLFLTGLAGFMTAVFWVQQDRATWHLILWTFGATMTGLATFGHHTENIVALMIRMNKTALSPALQAELEEEIQLDPIGILDTQPTPKLAVFITLFALALQAIAVTKIGSLI